MKKKKIIILTSIIFLSLMITTAGIILTKILTTDKKPIQDVTQDFSTSTIISNQWYSSIYKSFPSQQMFAFPLAYRISDNGLEIALPNVNKTESTIYGSFIQDLTIGLKDPLQKPIVKRVGNWSVGLQMKSTQGETMSYTLAQGVPSTTLDTNRQQLIIKLPDAYSLYNNGTEPINSTKQTIKTDAFRLTSRGHEYIIVLPKKTNIQINDKLITVSSKQIFIAALDRPENFELFKKSAPAEIKSTTVTWDIQPNTLSTEYNFVTDRGKPLVTLLPHQYDSLIKGEKLDILGTYKTIRGTLRLVKTSSFKTSLPLIIPDETFSQLKINHIDFITSLRQDQQKILHDNQPAEGDYFLGTWYGKAINILLLCDAAGLTKEKQELIKYIEPKLAQSLTYFHYDAKQKSMIADKPEFGNENLNDHHFHYGYYIRAAAILSKYDHSFKGKIQAQINSLVSDIANSKYDKNFPFIRNFAVYESHSWADGYANFGDGNDQESSSEAINAWYSIYLWAKVNNNKPLENTALYLFNSEIDGTKYYWFGKNQMYTPPYNHAIGSIIWGGKIDFATWFSGETNMKYGIQMLPITPASFSYLGTLGNFTPYLEDFNQSGGDISKSWGDLFLIFQSFYQPQNALQQKNLATKPEENTPNSLMLYTLYRNSNQ